MQGVNLTRQGGGGGGGIVFGFWVYLLLTSSLSDHDA